MENRPLRVPANTKPSFFNRDASAGFAIGNIATAATPGWTGLTAIVAGFVAGGIYGKEKQQRELRDGKLVHPPSYLNKNALTGVSDGLIIGGFVGIFTGGTGLLAMGLASGLGMIGSAYGHQRMKNDYKAAQKYVQQHGEYHPHRGENRIEANQPSMQPSPQELAQLEARLTRVSHTDRLAEAPTPEHPQR